MAKCVYNRRRLLERPFHRSRPNCLTAERSLQRPNSISSGQLRRYMQVGLTTPQCDEVRHMLTEYICCSLVPFVSIAGADTVRLSHFPSRVHDH